MPPEYLDDYYVPYNQLHSQHSINIPFPNGKHFVELTGVVSYVVQGKGQDWYRCILHVDLFVPAIPQNKELHIQEWTVFMCPLAIQNDREALNAGWAVDEFKLNMVGPHHLTDDHKARIKGHLAVRDSDGAILRVGYHVSFYGEYVDKPIDHL